MGGSFHAWLEKRGPGGCLIDLVDDATSTVLAQLHEEETTWGGGADLADGAIRQAKGRVEHSHGTHQDRFIRRCGSARSPRMSRPISSCAISIRRSTTGGSRFRQRAAICMSRCHSTSIGTRCFVWSSRARRAGIGRASASCSGQTQTPAEIRYSRRHPLASAAAGAARSIQG